MLRTVRLLWISPLLTLAALSASPPAAHAQQAAQGEARVDSNLAPAPQPTAAAPIAAPAPERPNDTPNGFWIGLGGNDWVNGGGFGGVRLEMGVPIVKLPVGQLSLTLPVIFSPDRYDVLGYSVHDYWIHIAPTIRWEFPVLERWGRLMIWAGAGGGVMIDRYKDNGGGGTPPYSDTSVLGVIRFASGATFVFPFGLFITFQPLGIMATAGQSSGAAYYEISSVVGYRFR